MTATTSLTEALSILGVTHKRDEKTTNDYRHTWFAPDGSVIGRFDAHEGWAKLKQITALVAEERAA